MPFEQAMRDLASADAAVRLRAVQRLRQAAYLEAAIPLAALVTDPQDEIQLEAIAAELNIFLAEPIAARKRGAILSEQAFSAGPPALGVRPVPMELLTALRLGARDESPRVALEALYAFGALGSEAAGAARQALLRASGPDIAAFVGASDPAKRCAAVRVLGRVFARRAKDDPIDETVGDAVITALNDDDLTVKGAAMQALGAMRYARAIQALTALFQFYGKSDAADAALDGLARIAHPTITPLLTAQLSGKSSPRRGIAIEGLGRIGDRSKLREIQQALDADRNDGVTLAGVYALALLTNAPIDRLADALTRPSCTTSRSSIGRARSRTHAGRGQPSPGSRPPAAPRHRRSARPERRSGGAGAGRTAAEGSRSASGPCRGAGCRQAQAGSGTLNNDQRRARRTRRDTLCLRIPRFLRSTS